MLDGPRTRVLVVEPHAALRSELVNALERLGLAVDAAADARAGAVLVEGRRIAVALVDADAPAATDFVCAGHPVGGWILLRGRPEASRPNVEWPRHETLHKPFSIEALEAVLWPLLALAQGPRRAPEAAILRTRHPELRATLARAREWAGREGGLSIVGELGTGRLALARQIHAWSPRRGAPLVWLDRAGWQHVDGPAAALEELLERARGGTVVVVDLEECSSRERTALLAVLRRESGDRPRWISISQRPLEEASALGAIEVELVYRLEPAVFRMPPLRERSLDLAAIAEAFARNVAQELGGEPLEVSPAFVERLLEDGVPGNRLGLEARLRTDRIRRDAGADPVTCGAGSGDSEAGPLLDLKSLERDAIRRALAHWNGNRTRASASLGISVRTLRNKIREYALR